MNSRVFVVQQAEGRDIQQASEYGDLVTLLPPGDVVLSPAPTLDRLRRGLRDYTPKDYLLLMGDPVAIGLACVLVSKRTGGLLRMLKWDKRKRMYYAIEANMDGRHDFRD